jgi:hypothetical protein
MSAPSGSYLVECYWPDITEGKLHDATRRIEEAATSSRQTELSVVYMGALLMPADETVFFLFDGSEEDIRTISEQAGLPFERVSASRWLDPGSAPADAEPREPN